MIGTVLKSCSSLREEEWWGRSGHWVMKETTSLSLVVMLSGLVRGDQVT